MVDTVVYSSLASLDGDDYDNSLVDPLLNYISGDCSGLKTKGYHVIPSVLTKDECNEALHKLWDFVEDVSGGCIDRDDPTSWYSPSIDNDGEEEREDVDPWPHSGDQSSPDMFQSLGAGYVLGDVRVRLAERVFQPLFGTRELLSSKEGFSFCRPLIAELDGKSPVDGSENEFVRTPQQLNSFARDREELPEISKKQYQRNRRKLDKDKRIKDLTGFCYIRASVSFTDQSLDKDHGGGHFLIQQLKEMGCPEKKIYVNAGDVILWRPDLVSEADKLLNHNAFHAVAYFSMMPVQAVRDYTMYSLRRHNLIRGRCKMGMLPVSTNSGSLSIDIERTYQMLKINEDTLFQQKLEAYKTGRTGDHRPDAEYWHKHKRVTMWNMSDDSHQSGQEELFGKTQSFPPRFFQRPRYRLGAPPLTLREAELYGLIPYRRNSDKACYDDKMRHCDIERAVIRGVRFVDGVYKAGGSWHMMDGKFNSRKAAIGKVPLKKEMPICTALMVILSPSSVDGAPIYMSGQDKYLGGMASPCGRYVYGVPGHASRVVKVDVHSCHVEFIGPEFAGEFKWLRGVSIPGHLMGRNDDGSLLYPSGCCLALPCNSMDGCVLKIDCEKSHVTTFITGDPIPNVDEGWLYHGGNLAMDGIVYAIPASSPRVMRIDARKERTEYLGPNFPGKAKWYGGITGCDECFYGIPHNATGVLKINPVTQDVTILAEGAFPEGEWKWHGGLASQDKSKIIGFPNNADSVLVIDVVNQQVRTIGDSSTLRSGYHRVPQDARYKYLGGSLTADGKYAYLFPCDAEYVLRIDMETEELNLVGPHLTEGENKWQNGFVGNDGCIYGIPQRSSGVLRIIPPGVKRFGRSGNALSDDEEHIDVIYCGDEMVGCKDKFEGGVLGHDGKIYCIPLRAKAFIRITPEKKETESK